MRFLFLVPFLLQSPDIPNADGNILGAIATTDAREIDIPLEERDELSSCHATNGAAMIVALEQCWPILEAFQIYHEAGDEFITSRDTDKRRPGKQKRLLAAADKIIEHTQVRTYPMFDMPLILAHLMKAKVFEARGKYDAMEKQRDIVKQIKDTSLISEPGF